MIYCPKCHTSLVENAKFCHQCGTHVDIPVSECASCKTMNPADVAFCYKCGAPNGAMPLIPYTQTLMSKYDFEVKTRFVEQIKALFFEELKRLGGYIHPKMIDEYLSLCYTKGYTETVELRANQLADIYAEQFYKTTTPSVLKLEKELETAVSYLALYHITYNCKEVNPFVIPEKVLRYEKVFREKLNLAQMIADYMDWNNEKERVYSNFALMPAETLENATKNYLYTAKNEVPFFISDPSFWGKGKEGFAMTPFALYWKDASKKPEKVFYHHLAKLEHSKDWIKINTRYFNISPSINAKMLLLLDKLRAIYAV
jgi:Double zinc ribbon